MPSARKMSKRLSKQAYTSAQPLSGTFTTKRKAPEESAAHRKTEFTPVSNTVLTLFAHAIR